MNCKIVCLQYCVLQAHYLTIHIAVHKAEITMCYVEYNVSESKFGDGECNVAESKSVLLLYSCT